MRPTRMPWSTSGGTSALASRTAAPCSRAASSSSSSRMRMCSLVIPEGPAAEPRRAHAGAAQAVEEVLQGERARRRPQASSARSAQVARGPGLPVLQMSKRRGKKKHWPQFHLPCTCVWPAEPCGPGAAARARVGPRLALPGLACSRCPQFSFFSTKVAPPVKTSLLEVACGVRNFCL